MAVNKVIFGSEVLLDLTNDTVEASKLMKGIKAHDKAGNLIEGTNTNDADTQDANAASAEILLDKTAYVRGVKVTGTMPNNGSVTGEIKDLTPFTVPLGFHDGSGTVGINDVEKQKLIPANIKSGINILGIEGSYSGEGVLAHSKTVTPMIQEQTVLPDSDYDYLSQVIVAAIPRVDSENTAGGITVTIG